MPSARNIKESEQTQALWQRSVRDAVNGLNAMLTSTGPTTSRPPNPAIGWQHADTTLKKLVTWFGDGWYDGTGAKV